DGLLFENAMELVAAHLPEPSLEEDTDALAGALAECAALGVTGVHDFEDERAFRAFARLGERRELSLRAWMGIPWDPRGNAVEIARALGTGDSRLRVGAIKCFLDGSLGSRTALLLEPD